MATKDLYGDTRVTRAESLEHEAGVLAKRVVTIPLNLQERFDYSGRDDGQPIYAGYAARGLAAGADGWLLFKYTYDSDGFMTLKQIAYDIWDDRADGGTSYA